MRVLVTGASGFSGRFLAQHLAARGHQVIALSRRAPAEASGHGIHAVRGDLTCRDTIPRDYDAVIHAASTSPGDGIRVGDIARDNVEAMRVLVDHARERRARLFLFLSSLSLYGRIAAPDVDETTAVHNPDPYGHSKALGEALLADCAAELPSLALRLPAVIGPHAHRARARNWPATVLGRILAGQDVTIFNPDARFNNAVHVADLAELAERVLANPPPGHDAVVLGADGAIAVREAVERMMLGAGRRVGVKTSPDTRPSFTISSNRAKERYGYRPMEIGAMLERFGRESA